MNWAKPNAEQAGLVRAGTKKNGKGKQMIRKPIITGLGHVDAGKCVAKGSRVFLSNGELKPIENIFEEALNGKGKKTVLEDGIYIELAEPLFVVGEENGQFKPMIATHIWKLEKKELVRIQTENGLSVETTPEHPFPVLNENFGVSYVPSRDLKENEYLVVPASIPGASIHIEAVQSIFLQRLAEENFIAFIEPSLSFSIYKILAKGSRQLYTHSIRNNRFRILRLLHLAGSSFSTGELFGQIKTVKPSATKWRCGHGSKKIGLPRTQEEWAQFFYFVGLF